MNMAIQPKPATWDAFILKGKDYCAKQLSPPADKHSYFGESIDSGIYWSFEPTVIGLLKEVVNDKKERDFLLAYCLGDGKDEAEALIKDILVGKLFGFYDYCDKLYSRLDAKKDYIGMGIDYENDDDATFVDEWNYELSHRFTSRKRNKGEKKSQVDRVFEERVGSHYLYAWDSVFMELVEALCDLEHKYK
tara:strand:- start:2016 stop:2588 length:573 start_codon:yes stop_codon:yes gene_type:complete